MTYEVVDDAILVEDDYGAIPYYYGFEGDSLVILSPDGSVMWCEESAQPEPSQAVPGRGPGTSTAGPGVLVPGPDWPVYAPPTEPVSEDAPSSQALLYKFAGRWDTSPPTRRPVCISIPTAPTCAATKPATAATSRRMACRAGAGAPPVASSDRGQWMIERSAHGGDPDPHRSERDRFAVPYQVHVEDGETYWGEYLFDGDLYQVTYIYR